jgi:hypothetical protein
MIELFKMAIDRPLNAVIVVLCMGAIVAHTKIGIISVAIAGIEEQQVIDSKVNEHVFDMSQALARIEESAKNTKEALDVLRDGQHRLYSNIMENRK